MSRDRILAMLLFLGAWAHASADDAAPDAGRSLATAGVTLRAGLLVDGVLSRADGAAGDAGAVGLAAVGASFDTARAGLWDGGTFTVAVHGTFGRGPSRFVGDFQGTSNVEAPPDIRLDEATYSQDLADDRLRVVVGVHDANGVFDVLDNAAPFLNSSFGLSPELAQVDPSTFPSTELGVHLRSRLGRRGYALVGVYDAPAGSRIAALSNVESSGGLLALGELGMLRGERGLKVAVGGWYGDREFLDYAETRRDGNAGGYVLAERRFSTPGGVSIRPFLQLGWARSDRNRIASYRGLGVQVAGWSGRRPADRFGLAVADAVNAQGYLDANPGRTRRETVVEAFYSARLDRCFALQPDVQRVSRPDMLRSTPATWVVTLRLTVDLSTTHRCRAEEKGTVPFSG